MGKKWRKYNGKEGIVKAELPFYFLEAIPQGVIAALTWATVKSQRKAGLLHCEVSILLIVDCYRRAGRERVLVHTLAEFLVLMFGYTNRMAKEYVLELYNNGYLDSQQPNLRATNARYQLVCLSDKGLAAVVTIHKEFERRSKILSDKFGELAEKMDNLVHKEPTFYDKGKYVADTEFLGKLPI